MIALDLMALAAIVSFALNIWVLALWRRDIQRLRAELADMLANSHRRDPRTGRLLPLGK